jgi:D-glycero-D-manno-heptose 1,7-bisphosphate phosphatase
MDTIKINQAVILAGGQGTRLRPLTNDLPKPLVAVNGTPFLDYLLNSLIGVGITHIVLLVGYKAEEIVNRYGNKLSDGTRIDYSVGEADDATGRRLLDAEHLLDDTFMLLYADNYWPIDLNNMQELYQKNQAGVMTTVFRNLEGTGEYGHENNVEVGADGFVTRYDKSRQSDHLNGVDIGFFTVNKSIIPFHRRDNISFEEDLLPEFIADKQLTAFMTDKQYYYITDIPSLKKFEDMVRQEHITSNIVYAREVVS